MGQRQLGGCDGAVSLRQESLHTALLVMPKKPRNNKSCSKIIFMHRYGRKKKAVLKPPFLVFLNERIRQFLSCRSFLRDKIAVSARNRRLLSRSGRAVPGAICLLYRKKSWRDRRRS